MFHQTNDAELFREADTLKADGFKLKGNRWIKGKQVFLPLYEAKMLQAFDHRAADVVTDQVQLGAAGANRKDDRWSVIRIPNILAMPRFWVDARGRAEPMPSSRRRISVLQGRDEPDESANDDRGDDAARWASSTPADRC